MKERRGAEVDPAWAITCRAIIAVGSRGSPEGFREGYKDVYAAGTGFIR